MLAPAISPTEILSAAAAVELVVVFEVEVPDALFRASELLVRDEDELMLATLAGTGGVGVVGGVDVDCGVDKELVDDTAVASGAAIEAEEGVDIVEKVPDTGIGALSSRRNRFAMVWSNKCT